MSAEIDSSKFRRNYKACLNCRTRKVRCDLGPVEAPHDPPCARCRRERKECVFADSKRGGYHGGSKKKRRLETEEKSGVDSSASSASVASAASPTHTAVHPEPKRNESTVTTASTEETTSVPPPTTRSSEFTTMQGALVFLARAAGTIARADDRDNINAREIHEQLETTSSNTPSAGGSPLLNNKSAESKQDSDAAPTVINNESSEYQMIAPLVRPHGRKPAIMPPLERSSTVRPNPSKKLSDIEYIGENKMLTELEAVKLIELFFLTLHPFFPHIPEQLHDPQVLAGYPILLCAILTISSRYHPFENDPQVNRNSRNIQLHERLWIYCQRLISQTVWAEASTRSVGTVLAFLLFTEWNPRAIHWRWSDYANNPEFKDDMNKSSPQQGHDGDESSGLTGLDAMRRSDRMAWMLIGTSVRLAQDMGFIHTSSKIFVATHIAETNTAMNLGQRSMLAQSLSEIDVDDDAHNLGNDDIFAEKAQIQNDEDILNLSEEFLRQKSIQKNIKFTSAQKAKIELLKIMTLAYETIYLNGKMKQNNSNMNNIDIQRQNLTILSILSPLIENWYKSYKKLLKPCNPKNFNHHCNLKHANNSKHVKEITKQVDKESLICDYYYCQLYIYSLALSMENSNSDQSTVNNNLDSNNNSNNYGNNNFILDEISKAARYVELAYNAAKEILNAAIRVHKIKMLKYMPVRWVTRIVRSVAFIIKCFLTLTNATNKKQTEIQKGTTNFSNYQTSTILSLSIIPTEEIIQTIQRAAIVLREASPDELHLCTRYSTILMYLCSEMRYRSKVSINPPAPTKLDISGDEEEDDEQPLDEQEAPFSSILEQQQQQQQHEKQRELQQSQSFASQPPQVASKLQNPIPNFGYQQMRSGVSQDYMQPLPEAVVDWFMRNEESIGLDFVEPWTEMIEQHLDKNKENP